MRLRMAFMGASLAAFSAACAMLIDLPSEVRVAPDAATDSPIQGKCTHPLRIRAFNAISSPKVADVALPFFLGAWDYLRELNEKGGINGCPIDIRFDEVPYGDATQASALYEKWRTEPEWPEVSAVFGVSSADALALGPRAAEDKKVMITVAYQGALASPKLVNVPVVVPEINMVPVDGGVALTRTASLEQQLTSRGYPYVFFVGTDYSTAMRVAMYHLSAVSAGARVGFVHCVDNAFCTEPLPAGKTYAEELGLLLGRDMFPSLEEKPTDFTAKVVQYLVEEASLSLTPNTNYKPVTWLWTGNLTLGTYLLAASLSAVEKGVVPKPASVSDPVWTNARAIAKNIKIIANNFGFDEALAASFCPTLQTGRDGCERIFGVMPFLAYGDQSTGSSAMGEIVALHDKWRARDVSQPYNDAAAVVAVGLPPPTTRSVRYVQGHMNVHLFRMAVEKVMHDGNEVTGETLKVALETFQGQDTGGLTAPLRFSDIDHRPQSMVSIYGLEFPDASPVGRLVNIPPTRNVSLRSQWLGW